MDGNRRLRVGVAGRAEPKLGRMVLASLGLHLLVFLVFSGLILPRFERPRPPVYFVDLVNLPVARPQAGRPDARPQPVKTKSAAKKAVTRSKPQPPPPKAESRIKAPLRTAPPPKRTVHKAPPAAPAASYRQTQNLIEAMREKRQRQEELDALKKKLAALAKDDTRPGTAPAAPVGMPEGKGDQAGVEQRVWLQAFFKANWRLSKYQVGSRELEARVEVRYDARGNLLDYKMEHPSGDAAFDDSVKRAVLLDKRLPFAPGHPIDEEVVFNLKDLLE